MTALRGVRPRNACEPGSRSPSYASTSVRRTATTPSGLRCSTTAPSRSGATSSTGRSKNSRVTGRRSGPGPIGSACTGGPGGVPRCGVGQLGELLADPRRCRPAVGRAGLERTTDGEHGTYVGSQPLVDRRQLGVVDLPQLAVVLIAPADQPAAHVVRLAERDTRPHQ